MIALGKHPYIFMLETEARAIGEVMNLEQECHLQQIRDYDMTNISIHHAHPIVYDARNICNFFSSKLLPFLKKTALSSNLFRSDFKKCKQPYIDILEEPVKGCECYRNK